MFLHRYSQIVEENWKVQLRCQRVCVTVLNRHWLRDYLRHVIQRRLRLAVSDHVSTSIHIVKEVSLPFHYSLYKLN